MPLSDATELPLADAQIFFLGQLRKVLNGEAVEKRPLFSRRGNVRSIRFE